MTFAKQMLNISCICVKYLLVFQLQSPFIRIMFLLIGRSQITKDNGGNPTVKNRSVNWPKKKATQGVMDTMLVPV